MIERIKLFISHLGLSTRAFAIKCGIKQNTLSNQLNGMRELSLSTLIAILSSFPELSAEWLLRGESDMFRRNLADSSEVSVALRNQLTILKKAIAETETALNSVNELI